MSSDIFRQSENVDVSRQMSEINESSKYIYIYIPRAIFQLETERIFLLSFYTHRIIWPYQVIHLSICRLIFASRHKSQFVILSF